MRHKELELIQDASNFFGVLLRESLGPRVIGPNLPMVSRIRNQYYRSFIIKVERGVSVVEVKKMYESTNPGFKWDGKTDGGTECSEGVYYWIMDTKSGQKHGYLELIRK